MADAKLSRELDTRTIVKYQRALITLLALDLSKPETKLIKLQRKHNIIDLRGADLSVIAGQTSSDSDENPIANGKRVDEQLKNLLGHSERLDPVC